MLTFNPPKLVSVIELENRTSHLRKLVLHGSPHTAISINTSCMGNPGLGLLNILENGSPQWRQSSCYSWNQLPVQKQAHGQMWVTQYLMPDWQFQSWKAWSWKQFQNFGVYGNLQQMHILSPSTALKVHLLLQIMYQQVFINAARRAWAESSTEQHPVGSSTTALSVALPEDAHVLHTAPVCTVPGAKWEECWGRNSSDFLTLFTCQGPTAAPAHSQCSIGATPQHRGQEDGGHLPLLHGAQSDREGQKEILLYQVQEKKGAETLSKNGRESGVWTSALDSVWGLCPTSLHPAGFNQSLKEVKRESHLGRLRQGEREN